MIAKTFGKHCEVVIHDLSTPQNSVVYAVNNHVTGRQVGQTFNHLIKQVLLSKNFEGDFTANYKTTTSDGRSIKSSTSLIRDDDGHVIGALCVNYDMEHAKVMKDFLEDFFSVETTEVPAQEAEPFDHVVEIVDELIDRIISTSNVSLMKRKEKVDLIRFMNSKGIFLIKGAIEKVADKMGISKVTVYSYLDEIKKEEEI